MSPDDRPGPAACPGLVDGLLTVDVDPEGTPVLQVTIRVRGHSRPGGRGDLELVLPADGPARLLAALEPVVAGVAAAEAGPIPCRVGIRLRTS